MKQNKYQSYKPSGVEWIGDIPENWNSLKLKHEYKIQKGRIPKIINEKEDKGLVPYLSMEVLRGSEISGFVNVDDGVFVKKGQTLILWDGSNSGEIIKVEKEGILSSTMGVLNKVGNKLNEDFSFYQLKSHEPEIRNNTNGMGIPHVDGQYVRSLVLLTPPLQEQEQIVNYLDEKTTIIDKLISTKQRKVELLKEQRTTLINQVITKGLNPNVKMKDSGVEWIGEIPESWVIKKMKYCLKMISEKKEVSKEDIKISPENVENGTGICFNFYSDYTGEGMKFIKGDILLNKLRIYLKKILITESEGFSMGEMIVLRTIDGLNKYYYYTLFNQGLIDLLNNQSTGVKLPRVSPETILNSKIVYPPIEEQKEIIDYIDKHTKEIDDLVSMEQNKIELLKEYRQSLISEVITGKIKVV
jgi:restriction endonuclease S subunit